MVRSGKEHHTKNELKEHVLAPNEKIYVPVYNKRIKDNFVDFIQEHESVLIPGYVFIETDDDKGFEDRFLAAGRNHKIFSSGRILKNKDDNNILRLSDDEERVFKSLMEGGENVGPSYGYLIDDRVVVTDGPLKGREGDIVKLDRVHDKVILRMAIGGDEMKVKFVFHDISRKKKEDE